MEMKKETEKEKNVSIEVDEEEANATSCSSHSSDLEKTGKRFKEREKIIMMELMEKMSADYERMKEESVAEVQKRLMKSSDEIMVKEEKMKLTEYYEKVMKEASAEVEELVASEMAAIVEKVKMERDGKLKLMIEEELKVLAKQNAKLRRRNLEKKKELETEKIRVAVRECFMNKAIKEKEDTEQRVKQLEMKLQNQGPVFTSPLAFSSPSDYLVSPLKNGVTKCNYSSNLLPDDPTTAFQMSMAFEAFISRNASQLAQPGQKRKNMLSPEASSPLFSPFDGKGFADNFSTQDAGKKIKTDSLSLGPISDKGGEKSQSEQIGNTVTERAELDAKVTPESSYESFDTLNSISSDSQPYSDEATGPYRGPDIDTCKHRIQ